MDAAFGFLGAFVGAFAAGFLNWFLLDKQHKHAKELQDRQFEHSAKERQLAERATHGNLIAERDAIRADRNVEWQHEREEWELQRAAERQVEIVRKQRNLWQERHEVAPRIWATAKWIYQKKLGLYREYKSTGDEKYLEDSSPEAKDTMAQYKELRDRLHKIHAQILDEKLRLATGLISRIAIDMVETNPMFWVESTSFYGEHDPQFLLYPRVEQLDEMLGELLRGGSTEIFEIFEDPLEIPVPR